MAIIASALISAAAFIGGKAIYDQFRGSDTERHNRAMEKLSEETARYNKQKQMTLEYINDQLKMQQDAISDFNDIDTALVRYELTSEKKLELPEKPILSDYYIPSDEKINTEYTLLVISGLLDGFVVYKFL